MQKFRVGDEVFFRNGGLIGPIIDVFCPSEGEYEYSILRGSGECFWYGEKSLLFHKNKHEFEVKVKTLWDVLQ